MKRSITYLPEVTQKELGFLVESIMRHIPKCVMIILYGSYARGKYVLWDERVEFGIHTSYQSDLDIMVVTHESNIRITEWQLKEKVAENYHKVFSPVRHAAPQFLVEDINSLNRALDESRYFYTEVIKQGVKLYDNGKFKLVKPHQLSFKEIREIAEEEFNTCYPFANGFLKHAYIALKDGMCKLGAFEVHQACERYYYSIGLVFVNYRPKTHDLKSLESKCKGFVFDVIRAFPLDTEFERKCYELLCRAYIESRYNKDYIVEKEELAYMLQRTEILKEITYKVCTEKIISYGAMIETENQKSVDPYQATQPKDVPNLAADELQDYSEDNPDE